MSTSKRKWSSLGDRPSKKLKTSKTLYSKTTLICTKEVTVSTTLIRTPSMEVNQDRDTTRAIQLPMQLTWQSLHAKHYPHWQSKNLGATQILRPTSSNQLRVVKYHSPCRSGEVTVRVTLIQTTLVYSTLSMHLYRKAQEVQFQITCQLQLTHHIRIT